MPPGRLTDRQTDQLHTCARGNSALVWHNNAQLRTCINLEIFVQRRGEGGGEMGSKSREGEAVTITLSPLVFMM